MPVEARIEGRTPPRCGASKASPTSRSTIWRGSSTPTKFWRPDVRKLVLRSGRHSITFTVDNPFVVVDEPRSGCRARCARCAASCRFRPRWWTRCRRDSTFARLYCTTAPRPRVVRAAGERRRGHVRWSRSRPESRASCFPADRSGGRGRWSRARASTSACASAGFFTGVMPDSAAAGRAAARRCARSAAAGGSAFECRGRARGASAYRLLAEPSAAAWCSNSRASLAADSSRSRPKGRSARARSAWCVIDPGPRRRGSGRDRPAVRSEKDLTLELARLLKAELERRLNARVVLTRNDDRAVGADQRAEIANRARADLVLSLHFDGFPGIARARRHRLPPARRRSPAPGAARRRSRGGALAGDRAAVARCGAAARGREPLARRGDAHGARAARPGPDAAARAPAGAAAGRQRPGLCSSARRSTACRSRPRCGRGRPPRLLATTLAEGVRTWQRNQ